jgi:hypothetical protein
MTLVIPLHIEVTSLSSIVRRGFFMIFAPAGIACMGIVFGDIGTSPLYSPSNSDGPVRQVVQRQLGRAIM